MLNRLIKLLMRKKSAFELGISFDRSANFQLPSSIRIDGEIRSLQLPKEQGVKIAFIELLLDDCYGCKQFKRINEEINTVVDIGGNVGLFGIAARNAFPQATIHCYEPNPALEAYLVTQASAANFTYFPEAVGASNGFISLSIGSESVLTRSIKNERGGIIKTSFETVIQRIGGHIDFLKMDCEGAEWDIFNDQISWQYVNFLALEYHLFESWQTEDYLKNKIKCLGFEIKKFMPFENYGILFASRSSF